MKSTSGNVLLYVLLGVLLFGALSFSLTKQMGGGGMGTLNDKQAQLKAEELIAYATGAKSTLEQMHTMGNVLADDFSFLKPNDAGFGTSPHTAKVYHPAGGGLSLFTGADDLYKAGSAKRGWVWQKGKNVEWTPSAKHDVILTFLDVAAPICAAINERIYKSPDVPATTVNTGATFLNGGGDDADFNISSCASCEGKVSYCITDAAGDNAFYTLMIAE
jgi:hypothetical protein